jgi:hypothetical protein
MDRYDDCRRGGGIDDDDDVDDNTYEKIIINENTKLISIVALYHYVHIENYNELCHLIMLVENFDSTVLTMLDHLRKAQLIQQQYRFSRVIEPWDSNFGTQTLYQMSITDVEICIEEKVENILAYDIAILEFVDLMPSLVEKYGFEVPENASNEYLVQSYMNLSEEDILNRAGMALERMKQCRYVMLENPPEIQFDNSKLTERLFDPEDKMSIKTKQYTMKIINYLDMYFGEGTILKPREPGMEIFTYAKAVDNMSCMFQVTDRIYEGAGKRRSTLNARNFLAQVTYFMNEEEDPDKSSEKKRLEMEKYDKQRRAVLQVIRELVSNYVAQLLHIHRNKDPKTIFYSQLPLNCDMTLDYNEKPITYHVVFLQYLLNFAPLIIKMSD